jgi:hypothetical protein
MSGDGLFISSYDNGWRDKVGEQITCIANWSYTYW